MSAYTPGPWDVTRMETRYCVETDDADIAITLCADEVARANARLIAAAPDLLAAVKYHLDSCCGAELDDFRNPCPPCALSIAALKKAVTA